MLTTYLVFISLDHFIRYPDKALQSDNTGNSG